MMKQKQWILFSCIFVIISIVMISNTKDKSTLETQEIVHEVSMESQIVEIYTEDNKYRLFISHDGSSGVRYNNINTSNDIAKCVEDYLDSNF